MSNISASSASLSYQRPITQLYNHISKVLSSLHEFQLDAESQKNVASVLDALKKLNSSESGDSAIDDMVAVHEQMVNLMNHLAKVDPEFLESIIDQLDESNPKSKKKKSFAEFMIFFLSLTPDQLRTGKATDGRVGMLEKSQGGSNNKHRSMFVFLSDSVKGDMSNIMEDDGHVETLMQLLEGILEGGIENLGELSQLMGILAQLGNRVSLELIRDIEVLVNEFVEDKARDATDIGEFMGFMEMVAGLIGAELGAGAIDESNVMKILQTNVLAGGEMGEEDEAMLSKLGMHVSEGHTLQESHTVDEAIISAKAERAAEKSMKLGKGKVVNAKISAKAADFKQIDAHQVGKVETKGNVSPDSGKEGSSDSESDTNEQNEAIHAAMHGRPKSGGPARVSEDGEHAGAAVNAAEEIDDL
ncbi:MAG: hypothetical protein ACI9BD_000459 [Candidatus Marinamargulisbacteria bacterium]|jgi:hypothetical protein